MTPEDETILEVLQSFYDDSRLHCHGGYPAIITTRIPDYVVVAYADENCEPELKIHTWDHLRAWYGRALDYIAEYGDDDDEIDIIEALHETREKDL